MRHQEGTPSARIVITHAGQVISVRLEHSSGVASLDEEAVALVKRAQPLPALPGDMTQATIELVVPLRFQLR